MLIICCNITGIKGIKVMEFFINNKGNFFFDNILLVYRFPPPVPFVLVFILFLSPAILCKVSEFATIVTFVSDKFTAFACPMTSLFAMIAKRAHGVLMIGDLNFKGFTSTRSLLGINQVHAVIHTVMIPVICPINLYVVFLV